MNTTPPAVTIAPPRLCTPVFGTPRATSSSTTPSGTFHTISPRLRSIAFSVPHGGAWHGQPFASRNQRSSPRGCQRYGSGAPGRRRVHLRRPRRPRSRRRRGGPSPGPGRRPPQSPPPCRPGKKSVGLRPVGVKIEPPADRSNSARQTSADSGVTCDSSSRVRRMPRERRRLRREGLRGPGRFARDLARRHRPLLDREERLAGHAVEDVDEAHLRHLRDRGNLAALRAER